MGFKIEKVKIDGVVKIIPDVFTDDRGQFIKVLESQDYKRMGIPSIFREVNESISKKGTLRGLHFQTKYPQGKLVRVVRGSVYDVIVDLRKESKTYGNWQSFLLNDKNHEMLYIPPNFAHGFLALEEETIFSYKCTDKYSPIHDSGIRWDDSTLNISWPLHLIESIIISEKDKNMQSFLDFEHSVKGE